MGEVGGYRERIDKEKTEHNVEPGMTLKHYSLEKLIGRGKVANIFRAVDNITGERVSIKAVKKEVYVDKKREELLERFRREIDVLSEYHHPNLINLRDYGEDKTLFYVMDYIEGKDLFELLREKGPFEQRRAIRMAKSIASALYGLHERSIYHRDLKSENIMVDHPGEEDEAFILIDLGLGKIIDDDPGLTKVHGIQRLLGTIAFMPPEYIEGRPFDARGDIYSLSGILYEALCGRAPFNQQNGESKLDFAARIKENEPSELVKLRRDINPNINLVVMKGLEKDPDKRYQNCGELIADLEEAEKKLAA